MDHTKIGFESGELTPQFLNEEERELFAEALLREEAIAFLDSDLGCLLRGMAIQRREDAKEQLLSLSATDTESIRQCQFDAAVAGQFLRFIQEVLTSGDIAAQTLQTIRG